MRNLFHESGATLLSTATTQGHRFGVVAHLF